MHLEGVVMASLPPTPALTLHCKSASNVKLQRMATEKLRRFLGGVYLSVQEAVALKYSLS